MIEIIQLISTVYTTVFISVVALLYVVTMGGPLVGVQRAAALLLIGMFWPASMPILLWKILK